MKFLNPIGAWSLFLLLVTSVLAGNSCTRNTSAVFTQPRPFDTVPIAKTLVPLVEEISGIADSKLNPGFIWGHEDSGNPTQLFLISHEGQVQKKVFLKGITNRDWEDMVLSDNNIYIGEIGDNNKVHAEYRFYKFPEPLASTDTVQQIETIRFKYPDGAHDAEAFLVDSVTKDIFIVTKNDVPSKVYRLAYPYSLTDVNMVSFVWAMPFSGVVSASQSPASGEIIMKSYSQLYYTKFNPGQGVFQGLGTNYYELPYNSEPQGEAIAFAANNSGFFTLSEKGLSNTVKLFFYRRK